MPEEAIASVVARVVRDPAWADFDLVVLFGSAASGRLRPASDVDVFVRVGDPNALTSDRRIDLEADLSRALRREVDLTVDGPLTSVVLRWQIAAKGVPVHERFPGAWKQFVVDAIRAYVDLEPQLRLFAAATAARARSEGEAALGRVVGDHGR